MSSVRFPTSRIASVLAAVAVTLVFEDIGVDVRSSRFDVPPPTGENG